METLKKFWIYFLMFIGFFLFVTILTNFLMKDDYKKINYEIVCSSPEIIVTECEATNSNGYVKGTVTNNTGEHIPSKYLQIDIYGENDIYLGSEFKELKYFNINETINFDINYKYSHANKLVIGVSDKILQEENQKNNTVAGVNIEPEITEETIRVAKPIGTLMVLHTALGAF